jgi:putative sigma-54 modulation protein
MNLTVTEKNLKIIVTGKNLKITDAIKNYLIEKITQTEDSLYKNTSIHFNLEAIIKQKGLTTRAKDQTRNLYLTLDNVLEKVEKQLRKHKSRVHTLLIKKS